MLIRFFFFAQKEKERKWNLKEKKNPENISRFRYWFALTSSRILPIFSCLGAFPTKFYTTDLDSKKETQIFIFSVTYQHAHTQNIYETNKFIIFQTDIRSEENWAFFCFKP